jgi:hypothetical protein
MSFSGNISIDSDGDNVGTSPSGSRPSALIGFLDA